MNSASVGAFLGEVVGQFEKVVETFGNLALLLADKSKEIVLN